MGLLNTGFGLSRYDADEFYRKGIEAYRKNNLEEALIQLGHAIQLVPKNSEYLAARGFVYLEHGLNEEATTDFENAIKLYRFEMLAHYGRGIMAYRDKNWDEALAHFTDAWAARPERAETLYYLALTNHRKGNHVKALGWMQQAVNEFAKTDDKRKRDAERWLRELQKLAENQS